MLKFLSQGAEAKLYVGEHEGRQVIVKERFAKGYRHPTLDQRLTKARMKAELRGLERARNVGVRTPVVHFVNGKTNTIYMEEIEDVETVNITIRNLIQIKDSNQEERLKLLGYQVGLTIGKLHAADIIHGDLTTSNILVCMGTLDLVVIDFGLSHMDDKAEDKGVDLYVLERALASTHSGIPWIFDHVLEGYLQTNTKDGPAAIKKLDEVRLRGRKRTMIG